MMTDSPLEKAAAVVVNARKTIIDCERDVAELREEQRKAQVAVDIAEKRLADACAFLADARVALDEELDQ